MGIVKEKEASDVLEAALKQMDGIISGMSFVLFTLPVISLPASIALSNIPSAQLLFLLHQAMQITLSFIHFHPHQSDSCFTRLHTTLVSAFW